MNGRVYDYALGRFLGVDPFIQFPSNSQSLNPYSYILNNPLAGTDPTGYEASFQDSICFKSPGSCSVTTLDVTAVFADGSTKNLGTFDSRGRGGASNVAIPGVGANGNTPGSGEKGPVGEALHHDIVGTLASSGKPPVTLAQSGTMSQDDVCDLVPTRCRMRQQVQEFRDNLGKGVDAVDKAATTVVEEATNPLNYIAPERLLIKGVGRGAEAANDLRKATEVTRGAARFPEKPGQIQHIFRDAPGHLADTPANRTLLQGVANDASTTLGTDRFGNVWSARTLDDGTQVWVQARNGVIQNGGLNQAPRVFNPENGLLGQ
jgi:hypothetical protein